MIGSLRCVLLVFRGVGKGFYNARVRAQGGL